MDTGRVALLADAAEAGPQLRLSSDTSHWQHCSLERVALVVAVLLAAEEARAGEGSCSATGADGRADTQR